MAIASVQTAQGNTGFAGTFTITWPGNTTSGNLIVLAVGFQTGNEVQVTDSQGNGYNSVFSANTSQQTAKYALFYVPNLIGGTTPSITIKTTNGGSQAMHAIAREYAGLTPVSPLDRVRVETATPINTTHATGNTPPTRAMNELIIGVYGTGTFTGTVTAGTGFGNLIVQNAQTTSKIAIEDMLASSIGPQASAFTTSISGLEGLAVVTFADTPVIQTTNLVNYQFLNAPDGISVTEKTR